MADNKTEGKKKKKGQKMALGDFLNDTSTGTNWADEMDQIPSAPAAAYEGIERSSSYNDRYGGGRDRGRYEDRGGDRDRGGFTSRRNDRDRDRDSFRERPSSTPLELPKEPPYTAFIGNLPFDLEDLDVSEFFHQSKVTSIRIIKDINDKPKGFGYVEFEDLPSLVSALELNGESLRNRQVRVSIAEPLKEKTPRDDRTANEWRRSDNVPEPAFAGRGGSFRESRRSSVTHPSGPSSRRGSLKPDDADRTEGVWRRSDNPPQSPADSRFRNGPGEHSSRWGFSSNRERESFRNGPPTPSGDNWRDRPAAMEERNSPRQHSRERLERSYSGGAAGDRFRDRLGSRDTEWKGGAFQPRPALADRPALAERRASSAWGPSKGGNSGEDVRKRLELKPKVNADTVSLPSSSVATPTTPKVRINPFGEAKPRDEAEILAKLEQRKREKTSVTEKPVVERRILTRKQQQSESEEEESEKEIISAFRQNGAFAALKDDVEA